MWSASVAYASELAAPRGLVATAQGLLTAIIMGLGGVVGGLVGGLVLERWGAVTLFSLAGMAALAGLLFFAILGAALRMCLLPSRKPRAIPEKVFGDRLGLFPEGCPFLSPKTFPDSALASMAAYSDGS